MTLSVWFVHADHEGLLCCTLFSLVNFISPVFRYIVKALSQICSSATAPLSTFWNRNIPYAMIVKAEQAIDGRDTGI